MERETEPRNLEKIQQQKQKLEKHEKQLKRKKKGKWNFSFKFELWQGAPAVFPFLHLLIFFLSHSLCFLMGLRISL